MKTKKKTLLDFIKEGEEETKVVKDNAVKENKDLLPSTPLPSIETFILSRPLISKAELIGWAKKNKISVATVIKTVEELVKEGKIKKKLNDDGELVYVKTI